MTTSLHTATHTISAALDALAGVTAKLAAADLATDTPCAQWTIGHVLEHAALDQLAWAAAVDPQATPGPQADPFNPSGEPAERVLQLVADVIDIARRVWSGAAASAAQLPTPLPQGAMDARDAAAACAIDAAVHAWDVATALGRLSPLTDELAAATTPTAHAIVEPLRNYGVYAAALTKDPSDGAAAELLRYLGRDPRWAR